LDINNVFIKVCFGKYTSICASLQQNFPQLEEKMEFKNSLWNLLSLLMVLSFLSLLYNRFWTISLFFSDDFLCCFYDRNIHQ